MNAVYRVIAKYTGISAKDLKPEMDLESDLAVDSVTRYEIATACEAAFELEYIPTEDVVAAITVQDIVDLVNKYTLSI